MSNRLWLLLDILVFLLCCAVMAHCSPLHSPKWAEAERSVQVLIVAPVLSLVYSNEYSSVRLVWNPSQPGTNTANIAGYKVYWGVASRTYTNVMVLGDQTVNIHIPWDGTITRFTPGSSRTNATIGGLTMGVTYYFAATAYDTSGLESDYSLEVSYTLPVTQNTVTLNWIPTNQATVQSSTDLRAWKNNATTAPPWTKIRTSSTEFYRLIR